MHSFGWPGLLGFSPLQHLQEDFVPDTIWLKEVQIVEPGILQGHLPMCQGYRGSHHGSASQASSGELQGCWWSALSWL